jgi:ElaB/YqjD/DUF883 family membrane-anchored ribosome-binding protein
MISNAMTAPTPDLASRAANSADQAIESTRHAVNGALDGLAGGVHDLRDQASPMLDRASERIGAATEYGLQRLRTGSEQASGYIRHDPFKSVVIAAAAGALLMAVFHLMGRRR